MSYIVINNEPKKKNIENKLLLLTKKTKIKSIYDFSEKKKIININGIEIFYWRDILSKAKYDDLFKKAYEDISKLKKHSDIFLNNDTDLRAKIDFKKLVLNEALKQLKEPALFYLEEKIKLDQKCSYIYINKSRIKNIIIFFNIILNAAYEHIKNKKNKKIEIKILISVRDSGSGINSRPGILISNAFKKKGISCILLCEDLNVINESKKQGVKILDLQSSVHIIRIIIYLKQFIFNIINYKKPWTIKTDSSYLYKQYLRSYININGVKAILTINEQEPLSKSLGSMAKELGINWFGYTPVLVGNSPDNLYYPADIHFVYGRQMTDFLISNNLSLVKDIYEVGSANYEESENYCRVKCRNKIEIHFNIKIGHKIILLATENHNNPELEFNPIIRELDKLNGISIILKIHPNEDLDWWKDYCAKNTKSKKIQIVKDFNIFELIASADVLISINSNIIINAAISSTPVLSCDFSNKCESFDFKKYDLVCKVESISELERIMKLIIFDGEFRRNILKRSKIGLKYFSGKNYFGLNTAERIANIVINKIG